MTTLPRVIALSITRYKHLTSWTWLVIVGAGVLAYANSFHGPFIFDDASSIVSNPTLRHWWPPWQPFIPPRASLTVQGRPVLNFSLALNYALSGTAVWSYHLFNLAIHLSAALFLYGLIRRTLGLAPSLFTARANGLALAAALLWTVHPLQTEAVTYVVQRTESLMGLLYLATLYTFVRGVAAARPRPWYLASILCCFAGMATKEVMVSAPLIALLYDRTFLSGSIREAWRRRKSFYGVLFASWLFLGLLILGAGGNRGGSKGFDVGVEWWVWWRTQFPAILTYLRLALWPHPLVFEYGTEWTTPAATLIASVLVVTGLAIFTVWAVARRAPLGFLGVFFFAVLAPTSVTPGTSQMTAEHRMYLPLAAVLTIVVLGLDRILGERYRLGAGIVLFLAAGVGIGLTAQRNRDYRSELAIWQDTVQKRPDNALAHAMLAVAEEHAGDDERALENYHAAIRLLPGFAIAHEGLGELLFRRGQPDPAIAEFRTALALRPDFPDALDNLGGALIQARHNSEAIPLIRRALELKPDYAEAHYNLGTALASLHELAAAADEFQAALALQPDYAPAHYNLANTLAALGRTGPALEHYRATIALAPRHALAEYNLGNLLASDGKPREAIPHYIQAVRINPRYVEAANNLGSAYWELGRLDDAEAQFVAALRLDPQFDDARENLRRLRESRQNRP